MTSTTKSFVVGRLTGAPDLNDDTACGRTASFWLAPQRDTAHDLPGAPCSYLVEARGRLAEAIGRSVEAGMNVCVEGQIANRRFALSTHGGGFVDRVRLEALHILRWESDGTNRKLSIEAVGLE